MGQWTYCIYKTNFWHEMLINFPGVKLGYKLSKILKKLVSVPKAQFKRRTFVVSNSVDQLSSTSAQR